MIVESTKAIIAKLLNIFIVSIGAIFLILIGPSIDEAFPVVYPFNVDYVQQLDNKVEIYGTALKIRDCKPIDVQVLAYDSNHIATLGSIEYKDTPTGIIPARPKSDNTQNWGPWVLTVPINTTNIELSALHKCHILWDTRTYFTSLNLKDYK